MFKGLIDRLRLLCTTSYSDFRRRFYKLYKKEILVLGDSHVKPFICINNWLPKDFYVSVISVTGATASGLRNPRSKTQAFTKFRSTLSKTKAKVVVIQLGEVDTGFVIWWRAQKYEASVEEMLNLAVETYVDFIKEIISEGFTVICVSAPLPTIRDDAPMGKVAQYRCEVMATQKMRTDLTLRFNFMVENFSKTLGFEYVNLDGVSVGVDGLVCRNLLNDDPSDHHYNPKAYIQQLHENLYPTILRAIV